MNQTPIINDTQPDSPPNFSDETDTVGRFGFPSISTRHLLLLVVIFAIALVVWRANKARDTTAENGRTIVEDESIEGIHVPENPEDPLRADRAVIRGLKEAGVMG